MNRDDLPEAELKRCASCRADIVWTFTQDGKRLPVDVAQGSDGTLALTVEGNAVHSRPVTATLAFGRTDLHKSHFASCPNRAQHRRPKGRTHA